VHAKCTLGNLKSLCQAGDAVSESAVLYLAYDYDFAVPYNKL